MRFVHAVVLLLVTACGPSIPRLGWSVDEPSIDDMRHCVRAETRGGDVVILCSTSAEVCPVVRDLVKRYWWIARGPLRPVALGTCERRGIPWLDDKTPKKKPASITVVPPQLFP